MTDPGSYFLLVEDNEADIVLVQRAFKEEDFVPPVAVRDGQEAVDFLQGEGRFHAPPAQLPMAILLDLKMPGMSGLEFLEWLRLQSAIHLRCLPVIVLSTSGDHNDIRRADELGVESYMSKPTSWPKFKEQMKNVWTYWRERSPVSRACTEVPQLAQSL
jgi:CheY-like chemotaxis protein